MHQAAAEMNFKLINAACFTLYVRYIYAPDNNNNNNNNNNNECQQSWLSGRAQNSQAVDQSSRLKQL